MSKGRIIAGRYRLKQRLGRGSFGVVWEADELLAGEPVATVAVKIFTAEVDRREIALLARLSHPSILAYRAVVEDEDEVCLVTELADGGDGAGRLKAWPDGLPPEEVRQIIQSVGGALAHLHAEGWVHRDVKPANILFVRGAAKLGDVGTARALTGTARATSTASLAYAAPEHFSGKMGPGVDVYALGCAVYELLTGRLPFDGNANELVNKHLFSEVEFPADMPSAFVELIRGCTRKVPEQRWPISRVLAAVQPVAQAPTQAPVVDLVAAFFDAPEATPAAPSPTPAPPPKAAPPPAPARPPEPTRVAPQPAPAAAAPPKPTPAPPPPVAPAKPAPSATTSATPLDPALRRHLRVHGERWGDAEAWRAFMRAAEAPAREHGLSERDLIRRAGQLAPEVEAAAGDAQAALVRVRSWVQALGGPRWSAPAWAQLLDQLDATDEGGLSRVRDALIARLYPPGPGATRVLDLGGGVHHLLVYRPMSQLHKPTTQVFEAFRTAGNTSGGLVGVWHSANPVTVREWSMVTGLAAPPNLDPNTAALAPLELATSFLGAAQRRFPVDELRWPKIFEYDGMKAHREQAAAAAKAAAAPARPNPLMQRRPGVPQPRRQATVGGALLQAFGKAAIDMVKEMNEAWLTDASPPKAGSRLAMHLVSPVPAPVRA
jgi:serine/threonine-protein kinase